MLRAMAVTIWLWCGLASPVSAEKALLRPGASEPVIAYAARTRPRPFPVTEYPYDRCRMIMVNAVMVMTAGFTLFTLIQHHRDVKTQERLAGLPKRREQQKPIPERKEPPPRLPLTPRERAEHLRDRRRVHAEAIERLMGRM